MTKLSILPIGPILHCQPDIRAMAKNKFLQRTKMKKNTKKKTEKKRNLWPTRCSDYHVPPSCGLGPKLKKKTIFWKKTEYISS